MMLFSLLALTTIPPIQTAHGLLDLQQIRIKEYKKIQDVRDRLLRADPKSGEVSITALQTDTEIRDMGLDNPAGEKEIGAALGYRFDKTYSDYHPIDFNSNDLYLNYTIARTDEKGEPKFVTIKDGFRGQKLAVYKVKATLTPLPVPGGPPAQAPQVRETYVGVINHDDLANTLKFNEAHPQAGVPMKIKAELLEDSAIPVELYENPKGEMLVVLDKAPAQPLIFPDMPEFVIFKSTPTATQLSYEKKTLKADMQPSFAVKEADGVVDLEHVRRQGFLSLQKLRDTVKSQHPTTADFPPEMLNTDEFKGTGLNLSLQQDQLVFRQALDYKPEGSTLQGYHPIDYSKDKAAQFTTVTLADANGNAVKTVKEAFEGQKLFLYRLRVEPVKPTPGQSAAENYYGPMSPETLMAIKKGKPELKVTEIKEKDVPLNIYTNDEGDVAFVMAFEPKDALFIPQRPSVLVVSDPVATVKPLEKPDPKTAPQLVNGLHKVNVDFAIEMG